MQHSKEQSGQAGKYVCLTGWTGAAFVLSNFKKFSPGFLDGLVNSKLSARFSLDLLPGFELLAGKCVLYDTNATAGTVPGSI